MRYLVGQTADVEFGPFIDAVTGEGYLPDPLSVTVTDPADAVTVYGLGANDQLQVFDEFSVRLKLPVLAVGEWLARLEGGTVEQPVAESVRLFVDADVTYGWAPTVDQVAAVLRSRTRGMASRDALTAGEQGTFTATTRPTADQVTELILVACGELALMLEGRTPCTALLETGCTTAVTYRAAQLVEVSYFSEQTNTDQTAFNALQKLWDGASGSLVKSIAAQCPLPDEGDTGSDGGPLAPAGVIPGRTLIGPQQVPW